jgi:NAD(P)-dependent dehydrogenase (short-subunit alcohol dehydrogenase family)
MKIIIIGAGGTIGRAVCSGLDNGQTEIVAVNQTSGELKVDIGSALSIREMFKQIGPFDGLVCVAGCAYVGPLENMVESETYEGIKSKLMGQVNLVLIGSDFISANGFFTLTSGNLAEEPSIGSANLGLVNGALNGFVLNAALEMPRGVRLNIVSPSVVAESVAIYGEPKDRDPIPVKEVAQAYYQTMFGKMTGQIIRAFGRRK